jgi:polar amino acid transport system permease protein
LSQPPGAPGPPELTSPAGGGDRRSRILSGWHREEGARGVLVALASTAVLFGVLGVVIVNSPGWDAVRDGFFDGRVFGESMRELWPKFVKNVEMFLVAEAIVLALGLVLAVLRSLPGPVFFPIRLLAIVYIDLFRGMPTILVILLLGFGFPGLQLRGVPTDVFFWGVVAIVLVYSAYVAEVYRAGIESVHPSQDAAARSLGLSRLGSLRYVIVPQAVRRIVPPLLNDFIGLQKVTALVSVIGVVEALRQAQLNSEAEFNFTPYVALAVVFVSITIPLTRFTDWLIARERARRQGATLL